MTRRCLAMLALFVVLNSTGCALFSLILIPIKLFLSILGGVGSAVGVADTGPSGDPPAMVQKLGEDRFVVEGLRPDAPCRIVCSAPGCVDRTFEWPRDFGGRGADVAVTLERR